MELDDHDGETRSSAAIAASINRLYATWQGRLVTTFPKRSLVSALTYADPDWNGSPGKLYPHITSARLENDDRLPGVITRLEFKIKIVNVDKMKLEDIWQKSSAGILAAAFHEDFVESTFLLKHLGLKGVDVSAQIREEDLDKCKCTL